jgi:hypothetical protein
VNSVVTLHPDLPERVRVFSADALPSDIQPFFAASEFVVVDGIGWDADLNTIRTALEPCKRKHKTSPYASKPPSEPVAREVEKLHAHASRLFNRLFPRVQQTVMHKSFRPMLAGPEPMHFDSYEGVSLVTAYTNVSSVPRVYRIGRSFPGMLDDQPEVMRALLRQGGVLSYSIRKQTERGLPPIDARAPKHRIELAPGAIWFFDAKTVSHEVVYGEGVAGQSWEVPGAVETQRDILKKKGFM